MLKGLALTPPVVGRIAIGRVVEKNGRRLPEKDDEFTLTSQVQNKEGWVPHPVDAQLRKEPGAKLRIIPVRTFQEALDAMPGDDKVMLKLSIPVEPGLYAPLIAHPRVLRVVALSGGYSTDEACAELAKNPGMIASFSRGLLQDLRHHQSDEEFDRTLGAAIDQIYAASVA